MGTGYIPPPGLSTQLSVDGGTTYDSGKILLAAGQGVVQSRVAGTPPQILTQAQRIDPPETFDLFVPGAIAAATIGVWHNSRASGIALGTVLEANFGTAQTTGDPANLFRLHAADSVGNVMDLTFPTAAAAHYVLDKASDVVIAQPATTPGGNTFSNGAGDLAISQKFTTTSQLTVTGFKYRGDICDPNAGEYKSYTVRCQLMDTNQNVLATAFATPSAVQDNTMFFAFPLAIVLANATTYTIALDTFQNRPLTGAANAGDGFGAFIGGTAQGGQPITLGAAKSVHNINWGDFTGVTWKQIYAGDLSHAPAGTTIGASGVWTTNQLTALLGAGGGTTFHGDVTFSIATTGTPLGTAAGANANFRALLA